MSAPSAQLRLPASGRDAVIADVRAFGLLGVETGAFLLAPRDNPDVITLVALLGQDGVIRRRGLFVVTAPVIDRLFTYAEAHGLLLRSLVHSHEGAAFMSRTDKDGTIQVPGFVAAIVPHFAAPPTDPATWGWWTWTPSTWTTSPAAQLSPGVAGVIRCDSAGVQALSGDSASTRHAGTPSRSSEPVGVGRPRQRPGLLARLLSRLRWWAS